MLEMHTIVRARDEGYGEYIGEVVGHRRSPASVYIVKILACIEYPSQKAILTNTGFRRKPYPFLSQQVFSVGNVQEYCGEIPSYEKSIEQALLARDQLSA